jgi:hypothetical protein
LQTTASSFLDAVADVVGTTASNAFRRAAFSRASIRAVILATPLATAAHWGISDPPNQPHPHGDGPTPPDDPRPPAALRRTLQRLGGDELDTVIGSWVAVHTVLGSGAAVHGGFFAPMSVSALCARFLSESVCRNSATVS